MTVPPPDLAPRARALAPDFELTREIGRGGMGVVYLAHDVKLDRDVAVKVLPEAIAADPGARERFLREARTSARLSHPNIVPIYRADESEGIAFFVMGYVEGDSLADRLLARATVTPAEAVPVLRDVARALGYAHSRGVVHRDVKPGNVLLEAGSGRALVTDFGIARLVAASPLTATGQVLGTVHYMSPEQVTGEDVDGRADLYSLGVVAFQALSGRLPFDHPNAGAVLVAHVTKPAPPLAGVAPGVPTALAAVVDRCLAKDPADRYQTGADLAAALTACGVETPSAPPRAVAVPPDEAPPAVLAERDAQALWARAAALQAETGLQTSARSAVPSPLPATPASATSGYPLADVRAAAEEAGIPARYVERAAAELGVGRAAAGRAATPVERRSATLPPLVGALIGGSTNIVYETVVDGEVHPESLEAMVDMISRAVGQPGAAGTIGRSLRWSTSSEKRRVQVSVAPRAGRTTIRAEEQMGQLVGGLFGGIVGGGGGGSAGAFIPLGAAAMHSLAAGFGLWGGALLGFYGLARTIFSTIYGRRDRALGALVAELAAEVEAHGTGRGPPRAR